MAIHTSGAQSSNQPITQQQNTSSGLMPKFGISTSLLALGNGGVEFEKLYAALNAYIKEVNQSSSPDEKITITKVLRSAHGLNYSGIALSQTKDGLTSAHVLMVEKTGKYPDRIMETSGTMRYEVMRTPADALDSKYMNAVRTAVSEALKVDPSTVMVVDGTLIPNEFDFGNENSVKEVLINTLNAISAELQLRSKTHRGTNIADVIASNKKGRFLITLHFNSDDVTLLDQTGMPIRQDICIALSYRSSDTGNNRTVNQSEDTIEILRVFGYVDFEFTGPAVINGMPTSQKFLPNFVITHISSDVGMTPDMVMLGVATVMSLKEDMNWLQSFKPTTVGKGEIDLNDIGALNIENNYENSTTGYGVRYDTKNKSFSTNELVKFAQLTIRPGMLVSIDVPKAGPETWYMSVLSYIAINKNQAALARVNNFVNVLTNGAYTGSNHPIFTGSVNKIHGGYYKTKDGVKDIRNITSYLAVANYVASTNQAPAIICAYSNTLQNGSLAPEFRATERKKILDEMSNNSIVVKQFHDRLMFNSGWVADLCGALKVAGFEPTFSNNTGDNGVFMRRSSGDFSNAVIGQDVRIMGQAVSYSNYNNPFGYERNYY